MKAFPHQVTGIDFLANRQTACLWDEPGLGKTFQSLSALKQVGVRNGIIVCPASVRMVWKEECEKLNIDSHPVTKKQHLGSGLNIISYQGATTLRDDIMKLRYDSVILDEAHYLKGFNSRKVKVNGRTLSFPPKRVAAIYGDKFDRIGGITEKSDYIWTLTGTPMPNYSDELWSTLHTLFPDALEKPNGRVMTYWDFMNRYCKVQNNGFGQKIIGNKNLADLRDRLRGRILRRKAEGNLPSLNYFTLPVEGDNRYLKMIGEEHEDLMKIALTKDDPLDYLRKSGVAYATLRKITGLAKIKPVMQWVKESSDEKIAIYAHHKDVINEFKKLDDSVYIDGSCTSEQREHAVNEFQNGKARIFIGQNQAAGTGLTLTKSSVMLLVEPDGVPANNYQIVKRIHRISQNKSCRIYLPSIEGSYVDKNIMRLNQQKLKGYKELGL